MYIKPVYSLKIVLLWTRMYIYFFFLLSIVPVFLYDVVGLKWLYLPWLPIGLIGTSLAFITGFKNNASYERLWEARKIYGGIVNTSRLLATMVNDFVTNEFTQLERSDAEIFNIKKTIIMRHIAWMTSLRHALRTKKPWETTVSSKSSNKDMGTIEIKEHKFSLQEELDGYLTEDEKEYILSMTNKQAACINLQSKHFKELKLEGLIDDFRHMEFKNLIGELLTLQGKVERIKNFPYPRQFATLNLFFAWIFMILLPFGMMHEFNEIGLSLARDENTNLINSLIAKNFVWMTVPISIVISWVFMLMERVGDVSENPFEGSRNDVSITTISRAIEIDIREMIGDDKKAIPKPYTNYGDTEM
ncbi:bestrophin family protein [Lutimonas zeaxanthinifaciens]|uniref:bestrophin family protein n=1 Tax=Lutimonas zeaxanthinifaciens TaxID=3060215 RepID=UPI00265CC6C3|nr:bestrophin family ion channel [Lutimonas sp. YSD2104]WKK67020.1 bestrophin family ion channel [Lutimonas sp. YSD2104]